MGLRISDANEAQQAFLDEIAHDPSKGEKWIGLMEIVTNCMADIQDCRKENKEVKSILLRFLIRASAMRMINALDDAFPFDRKSPNDKHPLAPAIRLDTVKFYHLGGHALVEKAHD